MEVGEGAPGAAGGATAPKETDPNDEDGGEAKRSEANGSFTYADSNCAAGRLENNA